MFLFSNKRNWDGHFNFQFNNILQVSDKTCLNEVKVDKLKVIEFYKI